jgi:hypothetical protein
VSKLVACTVLLVHENSAARCLHVDLWRGYAFSTLSDLMAQVHLAAVFSQEDIDTQNVYTSTNDSTPVLRLGKAAADDGYDFISIPLTNNAWRARWKKMCLTDGEKQSPEITKLTEDWRASEGPFERSEMNITRLGQQSSYS